MADRSDNISFGYAGAINDLQKKTKTVSDIFAETFSTDELKNADSSPGSRAKQMGRFIAAVHWKAVNG